MQIGLEWAREILARDDADPVEQVAAHEMLIAHHQAQQLLAVRAAEAQQPPVVYRGQEYHPAAAEVAAAVHWTPGAALGKVLLAQDLLARCPEVFEALDLGRIDLGKAREIVERTDLLADDDRAGLLARAVEYAGGHTRGQLRAWLTRELIRIDPDASDRRRKKECRKRQVWVQPEADGMATFGAYLTAEEAQACLASVRAKACGIDGSRAANEADMLVAVVTGTQPGAPVPVQVIETSHGHELAGYGPLTAAHAALLYDGAPKIRLDKPEPGTGYTPGPGLARWIQARDRHCRFPGCRRPARQCQQDHIIAWPVGATTEYNLQCLCAYHHWLKTHAGWRVRALPGMVLEWTSPHGRTYLTRPDDP
jgi:hypothetical protein